MRRTKVLLLIAVLLIAPSYSSKELIRLKDPIVRGLLLHRRPLPPKNGSTAENEAVNESPRAERSTHNLGAPTDLNETNDAHPAASSPDFVSGAESRSLLVNVSEFNALNAKMKDDIEKSKIADRALSLLDRLINLYSKPNEELLLLVAHSKTIDVYELTSDEEHLRAHFKWSYGHPAIMDEFDAMREFRMLDENHFIYCGTAQCSMCKLGDTQVCDYTFGNGTSTTDEDYAGKTVLYELQSVASTGLSSLFSRASVTIFTRDRICQYTVTQLNPWMDNTTRQAISYQRVFEEPRETGKSSQTIWSADQLRGYPGADKLTDEELLNRVSIFDEIPLFSSPLDDTVSELSGVRLRFERNGFFYFLISLNVPPVPPNDPQTPRATRGAILALQRYGYNNGTARLSTTFTTLQCYKPAYSCVNDVQCKEYGERLSRSFHPTTATFSDAPSADPTAVYVVYKNQYTWDLEQAICRFDLDDIDNALEEIGQCDLEPQATPTSCLSKVYRYSNESRCSQVNVTEWPTVVGTQIAHLLVQLEQFSKRLGFFSHDAPLKGAIRHIFKAPDDFRVFYILAGSTLMRIKKDIFLSWRYNWQQELKMHGSIHASQSKFPPFAYEASRKLLLFVTGSQIRYEKMDCRSTNPVCTEHMWKAWGDQCIWCAQNGSSGFAVNRRYSAQHCVEGVLVRGVCPPQVTKVSRNGDAYLIEGTHFGNYIDANNFTDLVITACGDACRFGIDDVTETRVRKDPTKEKYQ
ncbi:hypothetical protein AAVH_15012 [Aphelenchoides avenae]|nr:hypothetical protein AAVH_15012 [Aphelenchus avenae]